MNRAFRAGETIGRLLSRVQDRSPAHHHRRRRHRLADSRFLRLLWQPAAQFPRRPGKMARRNSRVTSEHAGIAGEAPAHRDVLPQDRDAPQSAAHARAARRFLAHRYRLIPRRSDCPAERCETGVSKRGLFGDPILAIRVGTTLLYAASGAVSKMSP